MTAHVPVLTDTMLHYLRPERGGLFVDCTVGLGGHAKALLQAGATRLIGLDRDTDALSVALKRTGFVVSRGEAVADAR